MSNKIEIKILPKPLLKGTDKEDIKDVTPDKNVVKTFTEESLTFVTNKRNKEDKDKKLELVIDKREVQALKLINFLEVKKAKVQIIHENLDVGDFLFRYNICDNTYVNLLLIERKTISDLLSSIKSDGRYKEQKTRLKAMRDLDKNLRVQYLIEGIFHTQKTDRYFTDIDRKIVSGAYVGTIVRDQIPILLTKDFDDTMATLYKICTLIIENPDDFTTLANTLDDTVDTPDNKDYMIPIKIKKSENRDSRWCYLAILQQIQGVSDQVAVTIAEHYPNLQSLINAYASAGKDHATLLENIVLPDRKLTKTGKLRTIGTALSEHIWISLGKPQ